MIKLLRFALLFGLILAAVSHAENVASLPEPAGYIDDYAHVLSAPATEQLETVCRQLHAKTRAQVFLVTVHNLGGDSKEDFANQLFARWKIGEKKTDRGILILLAVDDHKRWIEVGYGLEGILNDAKVGDIGREMVPALKAANYDEAARIGVDDVVKVIAADSNVTLDGLQAAPNWTRPQATPPTGSDGLSQVIPLFLFLGFVGVILFLAVRSLRRRIGTSQGAVAAPVSQSNNYDPSPVFPDNISAVSSSSSPATSSDTSSSFTDVFSGGDGGMSGGGGAGGDW
jgi:uncharacterized protein